MIRPLRRLPRSSLSRRARPFLIPLLPSMHSQLRPGNRPMRTPLEQSVLQAIQRSGMLAPGDRVGVAVSGGADSVALLRAAYRLRDDLGITLAVVHFNHALRGAESDGDAEFVEREARARSRTGIHHRPRRRWRRSPTPKPQPRRHGAPAALHLFRARRSPMDAQHTSPLRTLPTIKPKQFSRNHPRHGPHRSRRHSSGSRRSSPPSACNAPRDLANICAPSASHGAKIPPTATPPNPRPNPRTTLAVARSWDFSPAIADHLNELSRLAREEESFWDALVEDRFQFLARHEGTGNALSIPADDLLHPLELHAPAHKLHTRSSTMISSLCACLRND